MHHPYSNPQQLPENYANQQQNTEYLPLGTNMLFYPPKQIVLKQDTNFYPNYNQFLQDYSWPTNEYYAPNNQQVSFGQVLSPIYQNVPYHNENDVHNLTLTAPVFTNAPLATEREISRTQQGPLEIEDRDLSIIELDVGPEKLKKFYYASTFLGSLTALISLLQIGFLIAGDEPLSPGHNSGVDNAINVIISVLLIFKSVMFACGSIGYLRKLASFLSLFAAMLIAHCLTMGVLMLGVTLLAPWIFKGAFLAYFLISAAEAIWFIPLVCKLTRALEKRNRHIKLQNVVAYEMAL